MPATAAIAICSNPDCTRHAAAANLVDLPPTCPTCAAPMVDRCWKCETPLTDAFSTYCSRCGVPLKRVLPRAERQAPLIAICGNPDCDWAIAVDRTAALPSRCPRCRTALLAHCWKCGTRVVDLHQHYCQTCGVPLKRHTRSAFTS